MTNIYADYIKSKGRDVSVPAKPKPIPSYPRTIGARTFANHEEYLHALGEFLNGY